MPLGVGWQDCQSFAHLPTPPTSAHFSPSRTLPCSVLTLTTIFGLLALTQGFLGRFWTHAGFLPLPHELLSTHEL